MELTDPSLLSFVVCFLAEVQNTDGAVTKPIIQYSPIDSGPWTVIQPDWYQSFGYNSAKQINCNCQFPTSGAGFYFVSPGVSSRGINGAAFTLDLGPSLVYAQ